jgi:hypothetical protein
MNMPFETFESLEKRNTPELIKIKENKQAELYKCKEEKFILIFNILSLQSLIAIEKEKT